MSFKKYKFKLLKFLGRFIPYFKRKNMLLNIDAGVRRIQELLENIVLISSTQEVKSKVWTCVFNVERFRVVIRYINPHPNENPINIQNEITIIVAVTNIIDDNPDVNELLFNIPNRIEEIKTTLTNSKNQFITSLES